VSRVKSAVVDVPLSNWMGCVVPAWLTFEFHAPLRSTYAHLLIPEAQRC